ncbi:SGNH/GDSL hydrolase family protein [Rickettsiella endosymbiont of Dermanyssus gallinae]|uniref:SGNH/GDSL hydrolase family protein n=1 Tax=Rickettsiella endosymbiont of Dermanyssus gallinae TaxID=2856608 RepID=UPI001C5290F5|nr:SGNH/GDSL hydrolase family protein [Rickettsiella endosymbiont of Dermanyssus gallinae]
MEPKIPYTIYQSYRWSTWWYRTTKPSNKEKRGLKRDDLCIIFSGANDIFTVGRTGEKAAKRAVDAIQKAIANLSTGKEDTGLSNYSKNIVIFSLPDISVTPHYAEESESKRMAVKETCQLINQHINALVNDYRYINFDTHAIYRLNDIANKESFLKAHNIKHGILFVGEGKYKQVLFVENGRFISYANGKLRVVDIKLSKQQQAMLGLKEGKFQRPGKFDDEQVPNFIKSAEVRKYQMFEALIKQVASQARLNADVRVFDAADVFAKVK